MSIRTTRIPHLLVYLASISLFSAPLAQAGLPFAESSAQAGCNLYHALAERHSTENLAIAPTNLCEALAMLAAGAQGSSKSQLEHFLASDFSAALLADEAKRLRLVLESRQDSRGPRLSVANGLFCQKQWQPKEAFSQTLEHHYGAVPQQLDFAIDPLGSLQAINEWICQATQQRIPRLLAPGSIGRDTRLVLASTLYFQGDWMVPFEAASTCPRAFTCADGSAVEIPTMELTAPIRVGQTPGLMTVALPYRGGHGRYSLMIVVPTGSTELAELEHQLTPQWLKSLLKQTRLERTHLYLPRFEIDSRNSLLPTLERLGLTSLRGQQADFSGIHEDDALQVSGVEHQVVISVHERGTEVAAATSIGMRCTAYQEARVMRVNRPFLFALVEEESGAILVLGKLCKPLS